MPTTAEYAGTAYGILLDMALDLGTDLGFVNLTNATSLGRFPDSPRIPFLAIDCVGITGDATNSPMGTYEKTATYLIEAWAQVTSSNLAFPTLEGIALASVMSKAIQDSFMVAGGRLAARGVRMANVADLEILNTESTNQRAVHVRMQVEVTYKVHVNQTAGV